MSLFRLEFVDGEQVEMHYQELVSYYGQTIQNILKDSNLMGSEERKNAIPLNMNYRVFQCMNDIVNMNKSHQLSMIEIMEIMIAGDYLESEFFLQYAKIQILDLCNKMKETDNLRSVEQVRNLFQIFSPLSRSQELLLCKRHGWLLKEGEIEINNNDIDDDNGNDDNSNNMTYNVEPLYFQFFKSNACAVYFLNHISPSLYCLIIESVLFNCGKMVKPPTTWKKYLGYAHEKKLPQFGLTEYHVSEQINNIKHGWEYHFIDKNSSIYVDVPHNEPSLVFQKLYADGKDINCGATFSEKSGQITSYWHPIDSGRVYEICYKYKLTKDGKEILRKSVERVNNVLNGFTTVWFDYNTTSTTVSASPSSSSSSSSSLLTANPMVKKITPYLNGKKHGIEQECHTNGNIKTIRGYNYGLYDGQEITYDRHGKIVVSKMWKNGILLC